MTEEGVLKNFLGTSLQVSSFKKCHTLEVEKVNKQNSNEVLKKKKNFHEIPHLFIKWLIGKLKKNSTNNFCKQKLRRYLIFKRY